MVKRECAECGTETTNAKYCTRSCAVAANNRTAPKRVPTKMLTCKKCGATYLMRTCRRTTCDACRRAADVTRRDTTLGDLVKQINPPKEKWVATLQKKYGVSSAKELNENQAQAVVKWAKAQVEKKQLDDWAQGAGQKREASQEAAPFQTT